VYSVQFRGRKDHGELTAGGSRQFSLLVDLIGCMNGFFVGVWLRLGAGTTQTSTVVNSICPSTDAYERERIQGVCTE
jgi:hypothetical protein